MLRVIGHFQSQYEFHVQTPLFRNKRKEQTNKMHKLILD